MVGGYLALKYLKLSRKFRWVCGGVCLCLAYSPLFLKTKASLSKNESSSPIAQNYYSLQTGTNCLAVAGHSDTETLQLVANDMAASLLSVSSGVIGDRKNPELSEKFYSFKLPALLNLSDNTNAAAARVIDSSKAIAHANTHMNRNSVVVGHIHTPNKHTVNISGDSSATLVKGRIKANFYADAKKLKIPAEVVKLVVDKMSQRLDFRNSIRKGDVFEVIYNKNNQLLYSRIITKRSNVAIYRFVEKSGCSYCFENGDLCGAQKEDNTFGRPLKGRITISDRYGMRRHPISGVVRFHTGVDLAAAFGEPVYAVQEGTVTRASYYGGYGKCIDIQHASGYTSRYAHLSRFNVVSGTKVRKGQLVGFVGSTGYSTGAHLHLELARNNKTMNPFAAVKMVPTKKAAVSDVRKFTGLKNKISLISKRYTVQ